MTTPEDAMEAPAIDRTSAFLALTIGLPFCTFKFLFGILAWRNGLPIPGVALMVWGLVDSALNGSRVFQALRRQRPATEYCLLAQIGKPFGLAPLLLPLDTFFAFTIICVVLWSGWIAQLTGAESAAWLSATTVNLLSVALMQVWAEYRRHAASKARGLESKA
ncbi:MAG: hypothetical protein ACYTFG_01020 [Planctomycetota bacterium]|jgi:hypothetical protein